MSLPIIIAPDSRLHKKARKIEEVSTEVQELLNNILATLHETGAIGLTANHIGIDLQLVVIDLDGSSPLFMVNPIINHKSDEMIESEEGSVSFPGIKVSIMRHKIITVDFLDYNGKGHIIEMDGLLSICAQHEIDQMNGITILDGLSHLKKEFFMKKLVKNIRKSTT
jgi:peptide deformylase